MDKKITENKTENTLNTILDVSKDRFSIFYSSPITENESIQHIEWATDNIEDFLAFATKIGVKIIYLHKGYIAEDRDGEHKGELGFIEVGFLHDNIFHTFIKTEDWILEGEENDEAGTEIDEDIQKKELLSKTPEEIAKKIVEFAQREYPDSIGNLYQITHIFWEDKGVNQYQENSKIRVMIEKANYLAEKQIEESILKKENEKLPTILTNCVDWAKENGFNKLTRANLQAFLLEKELDLSITSREHLWVKVNFELKRKKSIS